MTLDQAEAMVLADHVVVMRAGSIEQEGTPEETYLRPKSRFIAIFVEYAVQVREFRWRVQSHSPQRFVPGESVWVSFPCWTAGRERAGEEFEYFTTHGVPVFESTIGLVQGLAALRDYWRLLVAPRRGAVRDRAYIRRGCHSKRPCTQGMVRPECDEDAS